MSKKFGFDNEEQSSNPLQLNEQQEVIVWHRYPQVKPQKDELYLVTRNGRDVDFGLWDKGKWWSEIQEIVIAWANLPTGMQQ